MKPRLRLAAKSLPQHRVKTTHKTSPGSMVKWVPVLVGKAAVTWIRRWI